MKDKYTDLRGRVHRVVDLIKETGKKERDNTAFEIIRILTSEKKRKGEKWL